MHTDPPTYTHSLKVISLVFLVCLQFYVSCHVRPAVEFSTCAVTSVLKSVCAFQISTQELLYICACTHTCIWHGCRCPAAFRTHPLPTNGVVCSRSPVVYHTVIIDYFVRGIISGGWPYSSMHRAAVLIQTWWGGDKELLTMKAIPQ